MDCNKMTNFIAELKRLYDSRDGWRADVLTRICAEDVKTAIEIVQKWSDEHPKKTYAQDFFEKFPKAQSDSGGTPFACRKEIYEGARPEFEDCGYTGTCENCWNEPMEE